MPAFPLTQWSIRSATVPGHNIDVIYASPDGTGLGCTFSPHARGTINNWPLLVHERDPHNIDIHEGYLSLRKLTLNY